MSAQNDIAGLRQQIKDNAVLIFPTVTSEYRAFCMRHKLSYREHDAFNIVVRTGLLNNVPLYQAILTCEVSQEIRMPAMSDMKTTVHGALFSLLDVLSMKVSRQLEILHKNDARTLEILKHNGQYLVDEGLLSPDA